MQDMSGAHSVAPDGSRLGIMPTTSGGVATTPRAPGQDRPLAVSSDTVRPDRPRATPRAPGADVPPATTAGAPGQHRLRAVSSASDHDRSCARHQKAPGQDRPRTASSGAARPDRPRATPRAPGADVPPATMAGAPGQYRPSAAQWAPDHFRSRPVPTAPDRDRPLAASSDGVGHDRPRATLTAPDQDVPRTLAVRAPGSDRPRAVAATVAAADASHVLPPAAGPDSSHRGPAAGLPPTSVTDSTTSPHDLAGRMYTAQEVPQLTRANDAPLLATAVHLLQALMQRAQRLNIGSALDVLQRLLHDRPAPTPVSDSPLLRSLEAAATCTDTPPRPADPSAKQAAPPTNRPPFKPP